jgi:predicted transcriptional regulator
MVKSKTGRSTDRRQMTLEALADVDAGRVVTHEEVEAWVMSLWIAESA